MAGDARSIKSIERKEMDRILYFPKSSLGLVISLLSWFHLRKGEDGLPELVFKLQTNEKITIREEEDIRGFYKNTAQTELPDWAFRETD